MSEWEPITVKHYVQSELMLLPAIGLGLVYVALKAKNLQQNLKAVSRRTMLIMVAMFTITVLTTFISQKKKAQSSPFSKLMLEQKYSQVQLSGYSIIENSPDLDYKTLECKDSYFEDNSSVRSSSPLRIGNSNDVKRVRDSVLELLRSGKDDTLKNCFQDKEDETEEYILEKKWYKFCGGSVWLDKFQVHYYTNRIVYSNFSRADKPNMSLVYIQIFDKNWNEIEGYKFDNSDITYPCILPIKNTVVSSSKNLGIEDPRILLRTFQNETTRQMEQEPVIVYNSKHEGIKRRVFVYRPFQNAHSDIMLKSNSFKLRNTEKNWAPFFDTDNPKDIFLIYQFSPLAILRCSLDTGNCEVTDKSLSDEINAATKSKMGSLRGGSNLIEVPPAIVPKELNRKFWLGLARSTNRKTGCLKVGYRPHIVMLSKPKHKNGRFRFDYVSSLLDFSITPELWDPRKNDFCKDGKSVLIPNSIDSWNFVKSRFEELGHDLMTITLSQADRYNDVIFVRGMLDHLRAVLKGDVRKMRDHFQQEKSEEQSIYLSKCSNSLSDKYFISAAEQAASRKADKMN
ncbi:hypothetical protein G9P44_005516 [Scheffersomyces stipitis]|nr:hypothetical protein G9P44_005516 [Scheffersomyces stipitis]